MGDATRFEYTTTTVGYQLNLPTNAVEVAKATNLAAQEYCAHYGVSRTGLPDDALTVQSDGEQLVISWVKK